MAKPLDERIASALSTDRVTITTLEELIPEAEAEHKRLVVAHARNSADSLDFALSEDDREDAARKSERANRNAIALAKALEQLRTKLATKRESDSRRAAEANRTAALAERDELADRFRDLVPQAVADLVQLFAAIAQNAERLKALGLHVRDAEAEARDVPGNWYMNSSPVDRFAEMKIPRLDGPGRIWPAAPRSIPPAHQDQYGIAIQRAREERARWKRYFVTPPEKGEPTIATHSGESVVLSPAIFLMNSEQVAEAKKAGCEVELAAANQRIGLPSGGSF
ncbi:hypothetical protein KK137_06365 [Croceibacterium sp. LX-88]|uniref:Uncharacterized protein n=1 Tax=Croceibacterium selenioxidans TaxID=2838833 RepID=A0ABS5W2H4_9SPHN|nr:hypothetical protein [Croceibacterium selenioxidans]MBT2133953.1 hypothetical protein [Croceibacterium selenioxidans]